MIRRDAIAVLMPRSNSALFDRGFFLIMQPLLAWWWFHFLQASASPAYFSNRLRIPSRVPVSARVISRDGGPPFLEKRLVPLSAQVESVLQEYPHAGGKLKTGDLPFQSAIRTLILLGLVRSAVAAVTQKGGLLKRYRLCRLSDVITSDLPCQ